MGRIILDILEGLAKVTRIPIQVWFTIIAGFGVFVAQAEVGITWALAIWIPIWGLVMYIYRGEQ